MTKHILIGAAILASTQGLLAQVREAGDNNPARGLAPSGSYRLEDIETVNNVTGAVGLRIPLAALPPNRGGAPGFALSLIYNSPRYKVEDELYLIPSTTNVVRMHQVIPNDAPGWQYNLSYQLDVEDRICTGLVQDYSRFRVSLVLPDGSRRSLALKGASGPSGDVGGDRFYPYYPDGGRFGGCNGIVAPEAPASNGFLTYYTTDGTFLTVRVPKCVSVCFFNPGVTSFAIFFPDGSRVDQGSLNPNSSYFVTDRFGNETTATKFFRVESGITKYVTRIVDAAGRKLELAQLAQDYSAGFLYSGSDAIRSWGLDNDVPIEWAAVWGSSAGTLPVLYQCWTDEEALNFAVPASVPCVKPVRGGSVLRTLSLPAQYSAATPTASYSFEYNTDNNVTAGNGELSRITLPSGLRVSYKYQGNSAADATCGGTLSDTSHWQAYVLNPITSRVLEYTRDVDQIAETENTCYSIPSWDNQFGGSASVLTSTVTAPDGGRTVSSFLGAKTPWEKAGLVVKVEEQNSAGTVLSATYRDWKRNSAVTNNPPFDNPYVAREFHKAGTKVTLRTQTVDGNGNGLVTKEYGTTGTPGFCATANFANWSETDPSSTGAPQSGCQAQRTTTKTYWFTTAYYDLAAPSLQGAVNLETVGLGDGNTTKSRSQRYFNSSNFTLTSELRWKPATTTTTEPATADVPATLDGTIATVWEYENDAYGNRKSATEPGRTDTSRSKTTYNYDTQNVYITSTEEAALDAALKLTTGFVHDPNTGAITKETDPNNNDTNTTIDDLGRPTLITDPTGRKTAISYSLDNRCIVSTSDLAAGRTVTTVQHFDQLGRIWRSRTLEDGSTPTASTCNADKTAGIKTDILFKRQGTRAEAVSNPYRDVMSDGATLGWTKTEFDVLGRPKNRAAFSGSPAPAPWSTNTVTTGSTTTTYDLDGLDGIGRKTTDQAAKDTTSVSDGFGRLIRVSDGAGTATYGYDVLNNLTSVTQGTQTRTFAYDSLGRLITATNPETGAIGYTYDNNGAVATRLHRGITTTYSYDSLNRVSKRVYSGTATGGTVLAAPNVTFCYDGKIATGDGVCSAGGTGSNTKGRLTEVRTGGSVPVRRSYSDFDAAGRVKKSSQTIDGKSYNFAYTYNLAGQMTSQTYPSGRVVLSPVNGLGQPSGVWIDKGSFSAADKTFVYAAQYYPSGAVSSMIVGNGLTESVGLNSRLQVASVGLSSATESKWQAVFGYSTTANNGNVGSQTVTTLVAPAFAQSYSYDAANRLESVTEGSVWAQNYCYDSFGNRALKMSAPGSPPQPFSPTAATPQVAYNACTSTNMEAIYAPATNRLGAVSGVTYDGAGNMITDAVGGTATFDSESRVATYVKNGVTATYTYDGDGRRVRKDSSSPVSSTTFVYNAVGQKVAEYATPVPGAYTKDMQYFTADHLGSVRVTTDAAGAVLSYHDYLPFGEELTSVVQGGRTAMWGAAADRNREKFGGKERDGESGWSYFGARHLSLAQGRFTSPDQPFVDQYSDDPQSWNLYGYARNNPLKYLDPSGRDCVYVNGGSVGLERGDSCSQQGGTYVNGTIDAKSFTYDAKTNSLGYTYSNAAEGTGGAGSIGLRDAPTRTELGLLVLRDAGNRASRDIGTSAILVGGFATTYASTYAIPAVAAGLAAMGETGAVGPGVGLLKLAQKYGLNANSPKTRQLLENLNTKVEDFVGKYRLGSIKNAEGWKFDGMTVKEALDAGARKLLTDGRFDK